VADANASGISTATLRRAKAKLGVGAVKMGMDAGWAWALPASAEDAQLEEEPWEQDYHKALQRIPGEPPAMSHSPAGTASATTPQSSSIAGPARQRGSGGACPTCSDQIPRGRWPDMNAPASSGRCKAKPLSSCHGRICGRIARYSQRSCLDELHSQQVFGGK
jgi:hypothetical protein